MVHQAGKKTGAEVHNVRFSITDSPFINMKCYHPQEFNGNRVSCGRCPACRQNRINGWVVRLEKHERHQESAHFITLTYEDNQATKTKNGLLTLDYSHVRHFFKQLRRLHNANHEKSQRLSKQFQRVIGQLNRKKISYYCAGEYGTKGSRPHYHIILFNAQIELVPLAWSYEDKSGYRRSRGNVHTGDTNRGSVRYSLKYIAKPSRIPLFKGDDRTPEFSNMSKGIGEGYITPQVIKWHRQDILNRYYVPGNGGVKVTMPRYYADKIYTKAEKQEIAINLEEKSSDDFYKMVIKDDSFVRNYLLSQKHQEYKASLKKIYVL